jgi:hypothetical protein
VRAWTLGRDGAWQRVARVAGADGVDSQQKLQDLAIARARRRLEGDTVTAVISGS